MVEGAHLGATRNDAAKYGVQLAQYIDCDNTHDVETVASEQRISSRVSARLITSAVPFSVNFDDEPMLEAREINGDLPKRELATEFETFGLLPQHLP